MRYDGTSGYLVDSNVWIDCMRPDSPWHNWAVDALQACAERAPLHVNLIVFTELLGLNAPVDLVDEMLASVEAHKTDLPWSCAALAAKAFEFYRLRGGTRRSPMPDFYIGAHAAASNFTVLTRDNRPFASYFPGIAVSSPAG